MKKEWFSARSHRSIKSISKALCAIAKESEILYQASSFSRLQYSYIMYVKNGGF